MIPALAIGYFQMRLENAVAKDNAELWKSKRCYVWMARLYLVVALVSAVFWVYSGTKIHHMQNEREEITSFQKAVHFWVIFYVGMMYFPAWLLSLNFLCYVHHNKPAPEPSSQVSLDEKQQNLMI